LTALFSFAPSRGNFSTQRLAVLLRFSRGGSLLLGGLLMLFWRIG
jgi:hypothetical protein